MLVTILAEYGIDKFDHEEIKSGAENTTVKITIPKKEYILRVYRHNKKSDQDILLEIEFQEHLKLLNIPIPQIYKNIQGQKLTVVNVNRQDWQTILMEYVGKSDFNAYTSELISTLATTQAAMHLAGVKFAKNFTSHNMVWDEFKEEIIGKNPRVEIKNHNAKAFLTRAKNFQVTLTSDLEHGYNHLDLDTSGNIIIQENQILGIIDFDDLAYSACVACLAFTVWHILYTTSDPKLAKKYITEYEKARLLTKK